ncbi:MAG TPA: dTDP-4-dehydrorhamnose 3,5-epimerase family protein [Jatrophihabitantaceae bacterium]
MKPTTVTPMRIEQTAIDGMLVLHPKTVDDDRGQVRELFRLSAFGAAGVVVPSRWAQMNLTFTARGALRGLHGETMTKLVGVVRGTAHAAYVDARPDSPTYRVVVERELVPGMQVLVPPGVCNGFQATSDDGCEYLYCFDTEWSPDLPGVAVNPLDPSLGIKWPLAPVLSAKDANAPTLSAI